MELKDQIIQEYLTRDAATENYRPSMAISRTTICKWVQIYQGVHNLPPTEMQQKHYISPMAKTAKQEQANISENEAHYCKKLLH